VPDSHAFSKQVSTLAVASHPPAAESTLQICCSACGTGAAADCWEAQLASDDLQNDTEDEAETPTTAAANEADEAEFGAAAAATQTEMRPIHCSAPWCPCRRRTTTDGAIFFEATAPPRVGAGFLYPEIAK